MGGGEGTKKDNDIMEWGMMGLKRTVIEWMVGWW